MSFFRYVAPVVALASGALAATCSTSATSTITNPADASALASCQTYSGSIAIATDATEISIPVTRITENLVTVPNGMLTSLSAPSLRQVDGSMNITQQANLNTLDMPSIVEVTTMDLSSIGQGLLGLSFGSVGLTQVSSLNIADTYIQNFDGINLMTAENINVANNQLLVDLSMQLRNVTGALIIRGNTRGLSISLPNFVSAGQVLIDECSSVMLPKLTNVSQTIAFNDNTFQNLSLPSLANIGPGTGGLEIGSNNMLSTLTVPKLGRVQGGVVVANNTGLDGTISFPSLRLVGSATFAGDFKDVELPDLDHMSGTLQLGSTQNIQSVCSKFSNSNAIAGSVKCRSAQPTSSSSSTTSSSTSKSGAGQYSASPETVFSVFGALAALFGLLM